MSVACSLFLPSPLYRRAPAGSSAYQVKGRRLRFQTVMNEAALNECAQVLHPALTRFSVSLSLGQLLFHLQNFDAISVVITSIIVVSA